MSLNHDITLSHNIINEIENNYNCNNANTKFSSNTIQFSIGEYVNKLIANQLIPEDLMDLHKKGLLHIHDLSGYNLLPLNCTNLNPFDVLQNGLKTNTIESKPPKHFDSAVNQILESMLVISSSQTGGVSVDVFNWALAPYISEFSDYQVLQVLENYIFRLNQSNSSRGGSQCMFSSVVLCLSCPDFLKDEYITLPGGIISKEHTYKEYQEEADKILKLFTQVLLNGDQHGSLMLFPNTVYNVTNADLNKYPYIFELVSKFGTPYFVHNRSGGYCSSMGCRTRLESNYTNDPFVDVLGNGNNAIVTLNLPLIAIKSVENKTDFYKDLKEIMDKVKNILIHRNNRIYEVMNAGLLDGLKQFRRYDKGSLVQGICGLNECVEILTNLPLEKNIDKGLDILNFMLETVKNYSKESDLRFGLASSASENTAFRFASKIVKEYGYKYSKNIGAVKGPKGSEYLTNGVMIDVASDINIIERIKLEAKLNDYVHSASLINLNMGDSYLDSGAIKSLTEKIINNSEALFWAYTKNYSICEECFTLFNGLHDNCPLCNSNVVQFSRITGYYSDVGSFNKGKKSELKDRYLY